MEEKSDEVVMALLRDLVTGTPDKRNAATQKMQILGARTVGPLGDAMGSSEDKAIAKAAKKALEDVAHYAARPGASVREAREVAEKLVLLTEAGRLRAVRAHALYLLGFVARDRNVGTIRLLQDDSEVGEDARMALERMNSAASRNAMKRVKT